MCLRSCPRLRHTAPFSEALHLCERKLCWDANDKKDFGIKRICHFETQNEGDREERFKGGRVRERLFTLTLSLAILGYKQALTSHPGSLTKMLGVAWNGIASN